jgi:outer membrane immunogenic protein
MKRAITLSLGALALAGMTLPTSAADLGARPIGKAPIAAPIALYNWSGFYIGAHVGGIWSDKDWTTPLTIPAVSIGSHTAQGVLAGGQAGFNWQTGAWVFGIEGQWSWTNADGSHICAVVLTCATDMNWVATVAGRIGYAFNNVLLYAKGGVAFADEDHSIILPGFLPLVGSVTRTGWMVGAGLEWGFTPNWSAKIEYNFMDFEDVRFTLVGVPLVDIEQQAHVVKAGINYRFSWGGPGY